ncbi:hypothetical protein [Pseudoalteromonas phage J2-1_QLiu-2017]|nr:hypothetical protein [Pseudoalteromonas phage J2-1_QLiu-2017]
MAVRYVVDLWAFCPDGSNGDVENIKKKFSDDLMNVEVSNHGNKIGKLCSLVFHPRDGELVCSAAFEFDKNLVEDALPHYYKDLGLNIKVPVFKTDDGYLISPNDKVYIDNNMPFVIIGKNEKLKGFREVL